MDDRTVSGLRGRGYPTSQRLNPGELEELEAAARRGAMTPPNEALALVNTINALSRRIARRFNETAEARLEAAAARERAESAERALEARGPMADLGHLADAVVRAERAERRAAEEAQARNRAAGQLLDTERELGKAHRELEQQAASFLESVNKLTMERDTARAELVQLRGPNVPGDQADLRRILADRQARIDELEAERSDMLIRGAAGIVGRRLHQERERLEQEVNRLVAELAEARDEIARRYTAAQVGDLQTSEAELVSAPLKARVQELETLIQESGAEVKRLTAREAAAQDRAARHMRTPVPGEVVVVSSHGKFRRGMGKVKRRITELEQSVKARNDLLAEATTKRSQVETELAGLQIALDDWTKAGEKIAALVGSPQVDGLLEYQSYPPDMERSWTGLVELVKAVRAAIPRMIETPDA